jgi:predicted nucleic acid-binding protein
MVIFILDADALIKLVKADALEQFAKHAECIVPQAVFDEAVTAGKQRLYPDAFTIDTIITEHMKTQSVSPLSNPHSSLGRGEHACLTLHKNMEKNTVLVSDDTAFRHRLRKTNTLHPPSNI